MLLVLKDFIQNHSPLPIHQKNNTKYCSTHLHEQIKFYCDPCDQLCIVDEHYNLLLEYHNKNYNNDEKIVNKSHHVISMDKASEDIKKRLIQPIKL